ncbi:type II toxin-antitoxin system mRNA interferase toxin, RelE/StbE family [Candidatus Collierbacteria bacterium]|nr:type II toxin-antitoxin system mRNA interferase toxin, RelE/StbE family [Candidatus Collierbacteria bacterium]
MNISYSKYFLKRIQKKYKERPILRNKVVKQVLLFSKNPRHPSLKTHKLRGTRQDQYSFWIERDLRIVYVRDEADVIFTDILTHDEY